MRAYVFLIEANSGGLHSLSLKYVVVAESKESALALCDYPGAAIESVSVLGVADDSTTRIVCSEEP